MDSPVVGIEFGAEIAQMKGPVGAAMISGGEDAAGAQSFQSPKGAFDRIEPGLGSQIIDIAGDQQQIRLANGHFLKELIHELGRQGGLEQVAALDDAHLFFGALGFQHGNGIPVFVCAKGDGLRADAVAGQLEGQAVSRPASRGFPPWAIHLDIGGQKGQGAPQARLGSLGARFSPLGSDSSKSATRPSLSRVR